MGETEKLTGRGGPGRNQGRKPKLEKPARLSVNIEQDLMDRLDAHCRENAVEKKTGGTMVLPRGDAVSEALEGFLEAPGE